MKQARNSLLQLVLQKWNWGDSETLTEICWKCQCFCLNMAKLLIFRFSHIKQLFLFFFFFFLAVCRRACIFMARLFLRTCHWACYIALPAFLFRMASEAKNTPSGLTLSSWHSRAVKLTANRLRPSKWTLHNAPLTQGSLSVTACVSTHSYTHVEKAHLHIKRTMRPISYCF